MARFERSLFLTIVCSLCMTAGANADTAECERNHYILNSKSWAAAAHLGIARSGHNATLLADGKVLVEGGDAFTESAADHVIDFPGTTAELYDPATGAWTPTGSPVVPRLPNSAALLPGGKVLIVGGDVMRTSPAGDYRLGGAAELYDPQSGTWSPTGALHTPRGGFAMTPLANGSVLVAGGYDDWDNSLNSTEIYDPVTGHWNYAGNLVMPRMSPTATLLKDGRVLVVGGSTDDTLDLSMSSAELYDPITGQWTSTASMGEARLGHTATRLVDGTVLVAGGYHATWQGASGYVVGTALDEAEVFDPAAARWRTVGNLAGARAWHTATLLDDGTVLVAGGYGTSADAKVLTEEIYDPVSATWIAAGTSTVGAIGHTTTLLRDGTVLAAGGDFVPAQTPVDTVARFVAAACH